MWGSLSRLLGSDRPREAQDLNRILEVKASPYVTSHRCTASISLLVFSPPAWREFKSIDAHLPN
ncbi:hypothetical protein E1301_Tti015411 [Triplophysa tibetana]|uniref:Uncharacterized protein n=1 Tax=Triplophysa tibetana TaxID=1572043 RepID=A0A5A9PS91_9TELE|nr:hypothetical protein E1301_Tti015411 [Triplophysa tibetana]